MTRDCPVCSGPLVEDCGADDEGVVKAALYCATCNREYAALGEPWQPAEITRAARQVAHRLLGPSCLGRMHTSCNASGCECWCGHPGRKVA